MKFEWKGGSWYIDKWLATQLYSLVYNIRNDWDFVILITGDRGTRGGKSVLAMTICAYLAKILEEFKLNKDAYTLKNIYFDNKVMVKEAQRLPRYSVVHYDEGREGLAASKAMKQFQQDLMDFFAECGQLNHIFVIVCPDFFEMKESIAVGRSEMLINVYRKETKIERKGMPVVRFDRGFFQFFSKNKKQKLFDKARSMRKKLYTLERANFIGSFTNQYPLGEVEYKAMKLEALARFDEKHKEEAKVTKDTVLRNNLIVKWKEDGLTSSVISRRFEQLGMEFTDRSVRRVYQEMKEQEEQHKKEERESFKVQNSATTSSKGLKPKNNGFLDDLRDDYTTLLTKKGGVDAISE